MVTVWFNPKGLPTASTKLPAFIVGGIAERNYRQPRRIHFQDRNIGLAIGADQTRLELAPVRHHDLDVGGFVDHVIVGQDVPIRADDDTGPKRFLAALTRRLGLPSEELLEQRVRRMESPANARCGRRRRSPPPAPRA